MNLREALKEGKLEEFLKEHESDSPADRERLMKTLEAMEKPSPSPEETHSQDEET